MRKKLKVFHGLVNYGTQAGFFSQELRKKGVDSVSVIRYDPSERIADVKLLKTAAFPKRFFPRIYNMLIKLYYFLKCNTFHFYFGQTLLPNQWDLPLYRIFGKKVIFEFLGYDIRNYKFLVSRYNLPSNHPLSIHQEEHDRMIRKRLEFEDKYVDYKLCCLPSHFRLAEAFNSKIDQLLPLAIDIEKYQFTEQNIKPENEPLIILHAPTNRILKGTDLIIESISQLKNDGYNIELRIVEGITHEQLMDEYKKCDIFIAQVGLGWYGTVALEAMAIGRPTCAYIDEQIFDYIDYSNDIPVININKDTIYSVLKELIESKDKLFEIGLRSRKFVENYHDIRIVTDQLIQVYQKVWSS